MLNSLQFARQFVDISEQDKHIIMHARRSFLFHNGQPWVKVNNPNHDVTMGSYDGAEICDLVGLFLLSKLQHLNIDLGLYRDDGLGISSSSRKQIDVIKKKIKQI